MMKILDLMLKDLYQQIKDVKSFLFLLIMPLVFTMLFGFLFGGFDATEDPRLPVGYLDQAQNESSQRILDGLQNSDVIRLEETENRGAAKTQKNSQ